MSKEDNPKENEVSNLTELLANDFAKIDRTEITVKGLPKLYCRPLNTEQNVSVGKINGIEDSKNQSLRMCKFIVDHVIDENGKKAFKNYDNRPAHAVLSDSVDPNTVAALFSQMNGIAPEELEELEGK